MYVSARLLQSGNWKWVLSVEIETSPKYVRGICVSDTSRNVCICWHVELQKIEFSKEDPLFKHPSEIIQDYPLNLSISISGGKETNKDSPSSGE